MTPQLRILVVDDDPVVNQTMATALADVCGAQTWAASSGAEGLSLAALHRPDLVLVDLDMPGLNGLEMTTALRGNADMAATQVWMVTGMTLDSVGIRSLTDVVDRILQKPIDFSRLAEEIAERIAPHGPALGWATDPATALPRPGLAECIEPRSVSPAPEALPVPAAGAFAPGLRLI